MYFRVRSSSENQNGSELRHYGVKGMKWGIRNERETSGRKSSTVSTSEKPKKVISKEEFEKGAGLSSKTAQSSDSDPTKQVASMYRRAKDELSKNQAFSEWLKKNDKYDNYLTNLSKYESWATSGLIGTMKDKDSAMLAAIEAYYTFIEFDQDASANTTEDEKKLQEQKIRMADSLSKAIKESGLVLRDIQEIKIVKYTFNDGDQYLYVYRGADGQRYSAHENELSTLIDRAKTDSEKLKDFRNTSVGKRARERNVDTSKSVSITKRKLAEEEKEKVGKAKGDAHTYLSDHDLVNKIIQKAKNQKALKTVENTTISEMFSRQKAMAKRANEITQSKSVKNTMKKKLSNVANSGSNLIKNGAQAVSNFLKNPLNIQKVTTTTFGGGGTGSTTVVTKKKR